MIELLLEAERALNVGLVDQAERLYRQAADADPRNSIAVVGLARVALERSNDAEAYEWARRALAIDPENVAAVRLVARLEEVLAHRWMTAPMPEGPAATAALAPRVVPGQRPPAVPHAAEIPQRPATEGVADARAVIAGAPAVPAAEPAAVTPGATTAPLFAPEPAAVTPGATTAPLFAPEPAAVAPEPAAVAPEPAAVAPEPAAVAPESAATPPPKEAAPRHRSFLDRLLGRNRP